MKVACDNQVPFSAIQMIEARGFKVVYRARDEADHVWFEEALDLGATVFVSPDWDISFLCNKHNVEWLQLKQGLRRLEIAHFITKKLFQMKARSSIV